MLHWEEKSIINVDSLEYMVNWYGQGKWHCLIELHDVCSRSIVHVS